VYVPVPELREALHWLLVAQPILYKISMMTFNCIGVTCPAYFRDVCRPFASVGAPAGFRIADHDDPGLLILSDTVLGVSASVPR